MFEVQWWNWKFIGTSHKPAETLNVSITDKFSSNIVSYYNSVASNTVSDRCIINIISDWNIKHDIRKKQTSLISGESTDDDDDNDDDGGGGKLSGSNWPSAASSSLLILCNRPHTVSIAKGDREQMKTWQHAKE